MYASTAGGDIAGSDRSNSNNDNNGNDNNNTTTSPSPRKKSSVGKAVAAAAAAAAVIAVVIVAAAVALVMIPGVADMLLSTLGDIIIGFQKNDDDGGGSTSSNNNNNPIITILQPKNEKPKFVAREELVQHALDLINKDRADFGLPPVKLSMNQAAQAHAEDVFRTKQISHWMTNGLKPYMAYTLYGGMGSVNQNVAIAGFSAAQYEECISNVIYDCEEIDPVATIEELQYEMMYEDEECCDNGHRDNILNKYHTHVSIGIVYDKYYLAFVQNFENNYGLQTTVNGGHVRVFGSLSSAGTLDHIAIHYDQMPTSAVYEQNKHLLSYSAGELVATVVKPLPPGYYYKQLEEGYVLIVANRWTVDNNNTIDISFDLAPAVKEDGVYTLFATVKDADDDGGMFFATSYSIFVENSTDR